MHLPYHHLVEKAAEGRLATADWLGLEKYPKNVTELLLQITVARGYFLKIPKEFVLGPSGRHLPPLVRILLIDPKASELIRESDTQIDKDSAPTFRYAPIDLAVMANPGIASKLKHPERVHPLIKLAYTYSSEERDKKVRTPNNHLIREVIETYPEAITAHDFKQLTNDIKIGDQLFLMGLVEKATNGYFHALCAPLKDILYRHVYRFSPKYETPLILLLLNKTKEGLVSAGINQEYLANHYQEIRKFYSVYGPPNEGAERIERCLGEIAKAFVSSQMARKHQRAAR